MSFAIAIWHSAAFSEVNFIGNIFDDVIDNFDTWLDWVHHDDKLALADTLEKYSTCKIDHHILEYRMVKNDGSIVWILDRGVVIEKDMNGKPLKIVGTHSDLTKNKNAEEAIRMKEEKYRNIIANINLGLLEVDNDEKIQYANQRFCEMSGFELDEMLGKKFTDFQTKDLLLGLASPELKFIGFKNYTREREDL